MLDTRPLSDAAAAIAALAPPPLWSSGEVAIHTISDIAWDLRVQLGRVDADVAATIVDLLAAALTQMQDPERH